jgi:hypothetical protein
MAGRIADSKREGTTDQPGERIVFEPITRSSTSSEASTLGSVREAVTFQEATTQNVTD